MFVVLFVILFSYWQIVTLSGPGHLYYKKWKSVNFFRKILKIRTKVNVGCLTESSFYSLSTLFTSNGDKFELINTQTDKKPTRISSHITDKGKNLFLDSFSTSCFLYIIFDAMRYYFILKVNTFSHRIGTHMQSKSYEKHKIKFYLRMFNVLLRQV